MQGQKTTPETIYQIMASWAVTDNYAETARALNIPASTVEKIVKEHKDEPEFVELCAEKKKSFADKADVIIKKAMLLLDRRFDRAIQQEVSLDLLIDEIFDSDKDELSYEEKKSLVSKVRALQLQDIKSITTAIGTLYDKKALAEGKPTNNVNLIPGTTVDKLAEIAGYEKRQ